MIIGLIYLDRRPKDYRLKTIVTISINKWCRILRRIRSLKFRISIRIQ